MFTLPNLYNIVHKKHATVAEVLSTSPLNISFRRALVGNKLKEWHNLVAHIVNVNLQVGRGMVTWTLNKSGLCIVKSCIGF